MLKVKDLVASWLGGVVQRRTRYRSFEDLLADMEREAAEYLAATFPHATNRDKVNIIAAITAKKQGEVCLKCSRPNECPWCGYETILAQRDNEIISVIRRCPKWLEFKARSNGEWRQVRGNESEVWADVSKPTGFRG